VDNVSDNKGFTLVELIVAIAIIGILIGISMPVWKEFIVNANYRSAAMTIATAMREARSTAATLNKELEVKFDFDADHFWLEDADTSSVMRRYPEVETGNLAEKTSSDCDTPTGDGDTETAEFELHFNPNGSSSSGYVCILDEDGNKLYRIGIKTAATGHVVVGKWDADSSTFIVR